MKSLLRRNRSSFLAAHLKRRKYKAAFKPWCFLSSKDPI
ncbi:hypothetical protein NEOC65_002297 [Neochlamydia sp. AcF65]|nr:hypothetical protein [Neochlamydia sp. AcF65]MBS4170487.1 hypothetical protein [Neochlamydia sp. AcF95]